MKKFLIFLIVVAILVVGYMIIKSPEKLNLTGINNSEVEDVSGRQYDSPSASEDGTYTMDKNFSSLNLSPSLGESVKLSLKSGNLVVSSGSIVGGTMELSSSDLENITSLKALSNTDIKLDIKALVFERAKSTIDDLVYRLDTELTMNGTTYPVSFESRLIYRSGSYSITGRSVPDLKNWGIVLPSGESISLNLTFQAKK